MTKKTSVNVLNSITLHVKSNNYVSEISIRVYMGTKKETRCYQSPSFIRNSHNANDFQSIFEYLLQSHYWKLAHAKPSLHMADVEVLVFHSTLPFATYCEDYDNILIRTLRRIPKVCRYHRFINTDNPF